MTFRLPGFKRMVQAILRFFSYVIQLLVSVIFLAVGLVASLSDNKTFEIDLLPWSGSDLKAALLILGAFGLLSTVLAYRGKLKILFLVWTLGTVYLAGRGIFASGHQFDGDTEFKWALVLLACILATVFGAWSRFKQPAGK